MNMMIRKKAEHEKERDEHVHKYEDKDDGITMEMTFYVVIVAGKYTLIGLTGQM